MSVFVKVCGMTDAAAVTAAVDAGADALGFVFHEPSPRNVSIEEARVLASLVPAGVLVVAVMLHPEPAACEAILRELVPDVLQTDAADFDRITLPARVSAWPVIRESGSLDVGSLPDVYVYEGAQSGRGQQVDWSRAATVARSGSMLLAGGLSAENVGEALRVVRPWGVDVSSAVESAPGRKDPDRIRKFIRAAKAAQ